MAFDPESFRADSRGSWERAAAGWASRRAAMQRDARRCRSWLVDAADLQPGQSCSRSPPGSATRPAGRRARRAGGQVIITDGAEAMVAAARRHALDARALGNVQTRQMEAEWLDQGTATVDALLCRWGYMLLADPEAALREARRVLKPGGRLALAAWEPIEDNPWIGVLLRALAERERRAAAAGGRSRHVRARRARD